MTSFQQSESNGPFESNTTMTLVDKNSLEDLMDRLDNNLNSVTDSKILTQTNNPIVVIESQSYGLSGLLNMGNTCYMNSAIQAISHIYFLRHYLLTNEDNIKQCLLKNAHKILKNNKMFKIKILKNNLTSDSTLPSNMIDIQLKYLQRLNYIEKMNKTLFEEVINDNIKQKIHNEEYKPEDLTEEESNKILNCTMTMQMIKLLKGMWKKNGPYKPTSFRYIFSKVRDQFFNGNDQHDAEEAYTSIIQQMQEELSVSDYPIHFKNHQSLNDFITFKNKIADQLKRTSNKIDRDAIYEQYKMMKENMPEQYLLFEARREMKKYFNNYSKVSEIFTGFIHSSMNCPLCNFASNKFDAFTHLSLPIPNNKIILVDNDKSEDFSNLQRLLNQPNLRRNYTHNYAHVRTESNLMSIQEKNIYNCMDEFCKTETLDEDNLWECDKCKQKVKGVKKLNIWTNPDVLVLQIKRFCPSRTSKDSRLVQYPIVDLDIDQIMSPVNKKYDTEINNNFTKYDLQAVVCHIGGMSGGHYFTYAKDEDNDNWFKFDDENVEPINKKMVVTKDAYLLVYIKKF